MGTYMDAQVHLLLAPLDALELEPSARLAVLVEWAQRTHYRHGSRATWKRELQRLARESSSLGLLLKAQDANALPCLDAADEALDLEHSLLLQLGGDAVDAVAQSEAAIDALRDDG